MREKRSKQMSMATYDSKYIIRIYAILVLLDYFCTLAWELSIKPQWSLGSLKDMLWLIISCLFIGLCARCNIICVDPSTGSRKGSEPLYTLASYRRLKGQINFGVLLHLSEPAKKSSLRMLKTGMSVHADNS